MTSQCNPPIPDPIPSHSGAENNEMGGRGRNISGEGEFQPMKSGTRGYTANIIADDLNRADFEAFIAAQIADWPERQRADLARYLRNNPGNTVRGWKGKPSPHPVWPAAGERPWDKLRATDVRAAATTIPASLLPHNIRQAAARDPALVWNPLARKYRLRQPGEPRPA